MIVRFNSINPNDTYNVQGCRTKRNTPVNEYNCVGYAFETFAAHNIGEWEVNRRMMCAAWEGDYVTALKLAAEAITEEMPEWQLVEDYDRKTYPVRKYKVVAIRFSKDDYHAYKLGRNGCWYNKWGRSSTFVRLPFDKVYADEWRTSAYTAPYNSPILFFVKPR